MRFYKRDRQIASYTQLKSGLIQICKKITGLIGNGSFQLIKLDYKTALEKIYRQYLVEIILELLKKRMVIFRMNRNWKLSNKEISKNLNISLRTVKNQIKWIFEIHFQNFEILSLEWFQRRLLWKRYFHFLFCWLFWYPSRRLFPKPWLIISRK